MVSSYKFTACVIFIYFLHIINIMEKSLVRCNMNTQKSILIKIKYKKCITPGHCVSSLT